MILASGGGGNEGAFLFFSGEGPCIEQSRFFTPELNLPAATLAATRLTSDGAGGGGTSGLIGASEETAGVGSGLIGDAGPADSS